MQIVRLTVENFKRINAVEVEPDGSLVILGGDNEQGKTSTLDAIMAALCGKDALPSRPVHRGADKGQIVVDLGEVVVTRTFTAAGGGALRVEANVAGTRAAVRSPQEWLNERIGSLSFDPLEFFRAKPGDQAATLRRLVGLDTSALDADRAAVFAERTLVNRQARDAEGSARALPQYPDAPAEPVTTAALAAELEAARATNAAKRQADNTAADAARALEIARDAAARVDADNDRTLEAVRRNTDPEVRIAARQDEIRRSLESWDTEIARLERLLREAVASRAQAQASRDGIEAEFAALREAARATVAQAEREAEVLRENTAAAVVAAESRAATLRAQADALPTADESVILAKFGDIERVNAQVAANKNRAAAEAKAAEYKTKADALTARLADIDAQKAGLLSAVTFPVPGLGFDAETGGVTFDGLPLEQASGAQRIRISMALALAMNPTLRIVLIRDASLLDAKSMAMVRDMARERGAQVWVERVGDGDPGAVVIEDGRVRQAAVPAANVDAATLL